ncbi:MAG: DEAD/DEAH box helicase, partial [Candidatus Bathyarchaeota archaeon]
MNRLEARVEETDNGYHTVALKTVELFINETLTERNHGIPSGLGKVNVTEYYNAYRLMLYDKQIDQLPLDLPPLYFPSIGFWFTIPSDISSRITGSGLDFAGGLHAIEHAMIAVSPLHAI